MLLLLLAVSVGVLGWWSGEGCSWLLLYCEDVGKLCGDSGGVEFFYKNLGSYFRIAQPHRSKKALTPYVSECLLAGVRMRLSGGAG